MKTYDELYDNMYNPHLKIVHFKFIDISDIKPIIQPEIAEKMQNPPENKEKTQNKTEIGEKLKSDNQEFNDILPAVFIKDVTPKKGLFRRK